MGLRMKVLESVGQRVHVAVLDGAVRLHVRVGAQVVVAVPVQVLVGEADGGGAVGLVVGTAVTVGLRVRVGVRLRGKVAVNVTV